MTNGNDIDTAAAGAVLRERFEQRKAKLIENFVEQLARAEERLAAIEAKQAEIERRLFTVEETLRFIYLDDEENAAA